MYKVQVWSKSRRWVDRLATSNLSKAIALYEAHSELEYSTQIISMGKPTHYQYFGLLECPIDSGYPEPVDNLETLYQQLSLV